MGNKMQWKAKNDRTEKRLRIRRIEERMRIEAKIEK